MLLSIVKHFLYVRIGCRTTNQLCSELTLHRQEILQNIYISWTPTTMSTTSSSATNTSRWYQTVCWFKRWKRESGPLTRSPRRTTLSMRSLVTSVRKRTLLAYLQSPPRNITCARCHCPFSPKLPTRVTFGWIPGFTGDARLKWLAALWTRERSTLPRKITTKS